MSTRTSFQLPDLLNLTRPFELRTNRYCRDATEASEAWFMSLASGPAPKLALAAAELDGLKSIKAGLLAALCFPTVDAPQLRLLTDVLTVVFVVYGRLGSVGSLRESGWEFESDVSGRSGVEILEEHDLYKHLVPRISRLISTNASESWKMRFDKAVQCYRSAQLAILRTRFTREGGGLVDSPDAEIYMRQWQRASGWELVFLLLELAQSLRLPDLKTQDEENLQALREATISVLCCVLDIASFNVAQSHDNTNNLITVLMNEEELAVQGAVNHTGALIKRNLAEFAKIEKELIEPSYGTSSSSPWDQVQATTSDIGDASSCSQWSWIPFWRSKTVSPPPSTAPEVSSPSPSHGSKRGQAIRSSETEEDIHALIQQMKDCIVGCANWIYETELYFGAKGEEVRSFGWVFLCPKQS
ncbi:hypothetical protein AX16_007865 [Volvariella volvacea WC 439]|nr:hypothetical protein AX16_007865 [Volvariella volvacea WC 439]